MKQTRSLSEFRCLSKYTKLYPSTDPAELIDTHKYGKITSTYVLYCCRERFVKYCVQYNGNYSGYQIRLNKYLK